MSSDLPVGQQSKGSSLGRLADALHARGVLVDGDVVDKAIAYMDRLHGRYVREVDARAEVARVRTQVAEDLRRWILDRAAYYSADGMEPNEVDHSLRFIAETLRKVAAQVPQPAGSVVAALPDVVGTPDHPEARDAEPEESR